ncbi:hydroxyacid dehydrogenase [Kribbella deserti]|uniref:Hydroxyacid dehydrogenase n=1 Tax=Kribbella deserti TaxID=1926257 RepID=A0ABV6QMF6_9ACTN
MTDSPPLVLLAMSDSTLVQVLTPDLRARLDAVGKVLDVRPVASFLDEPDVAAVLADVEVVVTGWGCPRISAEVLAAAPKLRAILHAAGSVKHIVDPSAFERGIQVSSAVAANAVPVAEYTVAAIVLGGKRAFRLSAEYRLNGKKPDSHGYAPMGNHRSTVGLLGASRIGRLVAERLKSFDFDVLISDPYLSAEEAAELGARLCDNDTLFASSDIVSLHAPLLPETAGLVDARLLGLMPDRSVLINTARGKIVDAAALEAECLSGRIDAVLDVTDPEPLPADSPLFSLPNVFVTPHVAGALGNEVARLGDVAVSELERLVSGQPLLHGIAAHELGRIA